MEEEEALAHAKEFKKEEEKTSVEKVTDNYEKLKEMNDKVEAELLRGEELKAKIAVGGKTEAGQVKEEKKDENDHDYRVRITKELAEGKTEFGD